MIPVQELVYDFKLNLNKVDRQDNVLMAVENIVNFLNQAQFSWIKTKIGENNLYRDGYEATRKRIDDLQVLKVNNYALNLVKHDDVLFQGYRGSLKDVKDYMMFVMCRTTASKQDCKATLTVDLIRQNDLSNLYFDANFGPSYEWRSTIATIGEDNIILYTDGSFELDKVFLTYLRNPKQIDIEGYIKLDGKDSVNQDCELPYYAKQDIVSLACKFAAQSTDNQSQTAYAEDRFTKNSE